MRKSLARRNAELADMNTALSNGYIKFMTKVHPDTPETAVTNQANPATMRFPATAGTVSNGVWTSGTIIGDPACVGATGDNVNWARLCQSDGTTPVCDCTVGVAGTLAFGLVEQSGSSTANSPRVDPSGTPAADYASVRVKITTGGTLGNSQFQWSTDDGVTWQAAQATGASVSLGATGITLAFAAGTYVVNDVYSSIIQPVDIVLASASLAPGTAVTCSGFSITASMGV